MWGHVCLWPKWLRSQATNSQNPVSNRPTQARTRPDPQQTALFHAVLCCAAPSLAKTDSSGSVSIFTLWSLQWVPKDCAKKWTEQTNKCSSHLCLSCLYVYVYAICLCLHTCTRTVCIHLLTCMCVCVLAACNTSVFSCHYKCGGTTGL